MHCTAPQELDGARSLDDVVRIHQSFVTAMERQCGLGGGTHDANTWKHLGRNINRILDQVGHQHGMAAWHVGMASGHLLKCYLGIEYTCGTATYCTWAGSRQAPICMSDKSGLVANT